MKAAHTYIHSILTWRIGLLFFLLLLAANSLNAQDFGAPGSLRGQNRQTDIADTPEQEGQVNLQASDSLIFVFEEARIATLYGSSSVSHASGQLKAGKIALNLDKSLTNATTQTPQDTL